jgi:hypothetical protein
MSDAICFAHDLTTRVWRWCIPWSSLWFGLVFALRPQLPKHIRGGWSHYTDTSEPVDGGVQLWTTKTILSVKMDWENSLTLLWPELGSSPIPSDPQSDSNRLRHRLGPGVVLHNASKVIGVHRGILSFSSWYSSPLLTSLQACRGKDWWRFLVPCVRLITM